MMSVFKTDKRLWSEADGGGFKTPHIVSDNNLIKVVHRFVLSPFRTLLRRKCTVSQSSFLLGKRFFC